MPAGVIDITKYAMADRSQRVLVREPTTADCLHCHEYSSILLGRLGKFSENPVREFPPVDENSIPRRYVDIDNNDNCFEISKFCTIFPIHSLVNFNARFAIVITLMI